ncbi:MAG: MFS transporter [Candidatus Methylomirabilales bacterium]
MTSSRALAAYYFCYFAAVGVYEPYLTPFWREQGFSPRELGLLLAILPGVAVAAPFLWSAVADLTRRTQLVFLANTWLCAAVALAIPHVRGALPAAATVLGFSLLRSALIPIANSFTLRALSGRREGYAAVRLWGTVGYIASAVLAGGAMDRIGLRAGIHGIGLGMACAGLTAAAGRSRQPVALPPVRVADILRVLADRRLQLLLLAAAVARVSYGPYETFFTIDLEQRGLSRTFAGAAWALAAGSELLVMLQWPRLCAAAPARTWILLALGTHALRWLLSAAAGGPALLLLVQLTHALTFGAFYLAAVQEVDALAPDGLRATAQGAFASVAFGLGGSVGNVLSGAGYEALGMRGLYLAAALVAGLATALYALGAPAARKAHP